MNSVVDKLKKKRSEVSQRKFTGSEVDRYFVGKVGTALGVIGCGIVWIIHVGDPNRIGDFIGALFFGALLFGVPSFIFGGGYVHVKDEARKKRQREISKIIQDYRYIEDLKLDTPHPNGTSTGDY